jgi:hypothetical protein
MKKLYIIFAFLSLFLINSKVFCDEPQGFQVNTNFIDDQWGHSVSMNDSGNFVIT